MWFMLPAGLVGATLASRAATDAAPGASAPVVQLAGSPGPPPETLLDQQLARLGPMPLAQSPALDRAIASFFDGHPTARTYLQTDKPLYQPGETVWFRADLRASRTLAGGAPVGVTLQLISPRGQVIATKRALVQNGVARNDFALASDLDGGEYTIQLTSDRDGAADRRKIIVNTYEAPRLMKTLELLRKAYGEGDPVAAAIEIKRTTGEPFAHRPLTAVVAIDDAEVARIALTSDAEGKALARFTLPAKLARGDGFLTILAEDGGVTESIQKRIPIVMKTLALQVFPEGGDLVEGLASRVYFAARTMIGKPADLEGRLVDDRGRLVAELGSIHDGMGRFELLPEAGRRYHVEVTRPAGIVTQVELPAARPDGCVLRSLASRNPDRLRVAATCKTARRLEIEATLRDHRVAGGAFDAPAARPAVVELPIARTDQGAVRVTVFSDHQVPLAERLVYHGRGADLKIALSTDKTTYAPREPVKLHVHATDAAGRPVQASLGLAVVDDTVLSFADDKTARILAHLYLEPELGATAADPIEEPNFYFSDKPEAAAAMDALLATRGYRRFEWRQVLPAAGGQP
jgi:hypothetical protein